MNTLQEVMGAGQVATWVFILTAFHAAIGPALLKWADKR